MQITLDDYLANLPIKRQVQIAQRARELIAKGMNLQELRDGQNFSQQEFAEKLNVNQAAVSKMERRTDMHVSSLRAFIEAIGAKLQLVAQFPDGTQIPIGGLSDEDDG